MDERAPKAAARNRPRPATGPSSSRPAAAPDSGLAPAEAALIHYLQQRASEVDPTSEAVLDGWTYPSPYHLFLDVGRLFTPAPLPAGVDRLLVTFCYTNAAQTIEDHPDLNLVYVEGYGGCPVDSAVFHAPHAWAADGTAAIDPTWPDVPGRAYLGIPFADPDTWPHPLYGGGVLQELRSLLPILRDGLPEDSVADIGRPLPHRARPESATVPYRSLSPEPTN